MFSVGILQAPVGGAVRTTKKYQNCTGTVCVNIEAETQPINFPTLLRHTPCYLLEGNIKRNLKGRVPERMVNNSHDHDFVESLNLWGFQKYIYNFDSFFTREPISRAYIK